MGTSLAEQLQKLAAPQTTLYLESKTRASLVFDPKESAKLDRITIYGVGVHGFEGLKKLNNAFMQFEHTLFDITSRGVERSVESKEVNKKLDEQIRKFLFLVSPYLLLKSAHEALEWLITRFHIHHFNKSELLFLIMPYHETSTFVRVLQLMNLSDGTDKWHWLYPLQKAGVPLTKGGLLKQCTKDASLLRWVCEGTMAAVKAHGDNAQTLSTLLAFHCTTLVGTLNQSSYVTELQVTHILEALLMGLSSSVIDFTAASFMIAAQLARKTEVSSKLLAKVVAMTVENHHEALRSESVELLVLLSQAQSSNLSFSRRVLVRIANLTWFTSVLSQLMVGGVGGLPLFELLLSSILNEIQLNFSESTKLKEFVNQLLTDILLDGEGSIKVIHLVMDHFKEEGTTTSNDVQERNDQEGVVEWYSGIVDALERQYPSSFDVVVTKFNVAGKAILGLRNNANVFERLNHPNSKIRVQGVKYVVSNYTTLEGRDKEMLAVSLGERLRDDSENVVSAVLALPPEELATILGADTLLERLVALAGRYSFRARTCRDITAKVLRCLCTPHVARPGQLDVQVLLAVLPYVLPANNREVELALVVLSSEFGKRNKLLRAVIKGLGNLSSVTEATAVCAAVWEKLTSKQCLPNAQVLLDVIQQTAQQRTAPQKFLTAMLLVSAVSKHDSQISLQILDTILMDVKAFKLEQVEHSKPLTGQSLPACLALVCKGIFPLEGLLYCITQLMYKLPHPVEPKDMPWWDLTECNINPTRTLIVRIFDIILKGTQTHKAPFSRLLQDFFSTYFPEPRMQLEFVSNLVVGSEVMMLAGSLTKHPLVTPELHLQAMCLAWTLVQRNQQTADWLLRLEDNTVLPALMVALVSPLASVRRVAVSILSTLASSGKTEGYGPLLARLAARSEELIVDAEQLPLVLRHLVHEDLNVKSPQKRSTKLKMDQVLNSLLDTVTGTSTPAYVQAALLRVLALVDLPRDAVLKLVLVGKQMLEEGQQKKGLDPHQSVVLRGILARLNKDVVGCLADEEPWQFVKLAILDSRTVVWDESGSVTCPAVVFMQQVTREVFESLGSNVQQQLLVLVVEVSTNTDSPDVVSAAARLVKKISLDAGLVVSELIKMRDAQPANAGNAGAQPKKPRRNKNPAPSLDILYSLPWRQGITLLELIQYKKKLYSVHLLLPVLFDILKRCLEFEEQAPVEYTKQILLSSILHCCQKLSPDGSPVSTDLLDPERTFNVELVVQSIRTTQNPQTHHHSLLVLAHTAGMIPDQVLHNMMAIFTFMGSSVLRQDDAYSFQIISKVTETIIPILIKSRQGGALQGELDVVVATVLRVFVDAMLDIPEHRRLPMFHKLLSTMGVHSSLWLLLCLVFEGHVLKGAADTPQHPQMHKGETSIPQRLDFALNLTRMFPPEVVIQSCINVMEYVRTLPADKDESESVEKSSPLKPVHMPLFDVKQNSGKQLRHFKFTLTSFLSTLLSSQLFITQVAELSDEDTLQLEPLYRSLIENMLGYIQSVSREAERSSGNPTAKYWRVMQNQSYDILDKVNALLPGDMFLLVVRGLLDHKLVTVRRKAMELLNVKLQHQASSFAACNRNAMSALVEPLVVVIRAIGQLTEQSSEKELNQQTALISLKLLSRALAPQKPKKFKDILKLVTELCTSGLARGNILASVVLCIAELTSVLGAHAISSLPMFMPALIKILHSQQKVENPDLMLLSIVAATQKVVENLANFLSPYLGKLLKEVSLLSAKWQQPVDNAKITPVQFKLKSIRKKISQIHPRVLMTPVSTCHSELLKQQMYPAVGPLLTVLADSFSAMSRADLEQLLPELTAFFQAGLQFRSEQSDSGVSLEDLAEVEGHVVRALVALVLKLSEEKFKPFYYSLFHWATSTESHKDRVITFYSLSSNLAERLKGLFVPFAGHFLKNTAGLLDATNSLKTETLYFGSGEMAEAKALCLLEFILHTLHSVFLYDSQNFVTKERFDTLMQPLVDQLENMTGGVEKLEARASRLMTPCLAQFAVATADDTLWKQLNYQILLKTRHNVPQVRLAALGTVCEMARKLGSDFLPLLPETMPFLAELLEDEEEVVEKASQKAVQEMETILGEPLQKYF